ncbi:MAG: hypothetical protein ABIQ52_14990, partial [Vicinamibacterales bacterium]
MRISTGPGAAVNEMLAPPATAPGATGGAAAVDGAAAASDGFSGMGPLNNGRPSADVAVNST